MADELPITSTTETPAGTPPTATVPGAAPVAPAPGPSAAERRINQLFAQKKDAEERFGAVSSENETLRAELYRLQDELNQVRLINTSTPAAAPPASAAADYSGADVGAVVEKKLGEFEAKIAQRQQLQQAHALLESSKAQSFVQALTEFPELKDQNSPLFRLADRIMREDRTFQASPQGPYRAVLMARGILADAGPAPAALAAASSGPATGPAGAPSSSTQEKATQLTKIETELADVVDRQRRGQGDPARLWQEFRTLQYKRDTLTGGATT